MHPNKQNLNEVLSSILEFPMSKDTDSLCLKYTSTQSYGFNALESLGTGNVSKESKMCHGLYHENLCQQYIVWETCQITGTPWWTLITSLEPVVPSIVTLLQLNLVLNSLLQTAKYY